MYVLYVTVTDKMGPDAAKNVTEKKSHNVVSSVF